MKINCLSCGHTIDLDEAYSDYEGQVKCYTCSALLEVKLEESLIPTTIHVSPPPMWPVCVSGERDRPDGSSSVSMRQGQ